jgi:hypothetical protein
MANEGLTPRREASDGRWTHFGILGISTDEIVFSCFSSVDGDDVAGFGGVFE